MKSLFGNESGKPQLQKYYLTINLKEAHILFLWSCEQKDKYSFSKFCAYSPKNVLLLGSTPKEQWKCQVHENLIMKLEAMGCD